MIRRVAAVHLFMICFAALVVAASLAMQDSAPTTRSAEPASGVAAPAESLLGPTIPAPDELLRAVQSALRSGSPEQKERALEFVQEFRSIRLIPDVIDAIADATPSLSHGDTGWGFVGHQAASVLGRLGHCFDGVSVEQRGRQAYSFHDDMFKGGAALQASGRLAEVQKNWRRWWDANRKCAG